MKENQEKVGKEKKRKSRYIKREEKYYKRKMQMRRFRNKDIREDTLSKSASQVPTLSKPEIRQIASYHTEKSYGRPSDSTRSIK